MIGQVFNEIKKSFPEINSKIKPFNKKSFMWSSPITGNIYYNKEQVKNIKFSRTALKGALAHELSHQIGYKEMNFIARLLFKLRYQNFDFKRKIERQADTIAAKRGFGRELIQLLKESEHKFERKRFLKIKKTHLSVDEIKQLMDKKQG